MYKPKPKAIYYSKDKVRYDYPSRKYVWKEGKSGTLWSMGTYPTKIRPCDLSDDYIKVYLYGDYKYLRASGIKDMYYKPNMWINHFLKDDVLYISYGKPLIIAPDRYGYERCDNYDVALFGNDIMLFIAAAKRYSNYDVSKFEQAIKDKLIHFRTKFPEDAAHISNGWDYRPEDYDNKIKELARHEW